MKKSTLKKFKRHLSFVLSFLLICSLLLSMSGCALKNPKEASTEVSDESFVYTLLEESEESQAVTNPRTVDWKIDTDQVANGWKSPHIWRVTVDPVVWKSISLWDGEELSEIADGYISSVLYEVRLVAEAKWPVQTSRYTINSVTNTESSEYSAEDTPMVLVSENTWTMNVQAGGDVQRNLVIDGETVIQVTDGMRSAPLENWNYGGQNDWVIKLEGDYLYVMSYVDYAYSRLTLGGDEDPFDHTWLEGTEENKVIEVPEGAYYFEPIQGYLYEDAVIYTYEGSEMTTARGAALTLATQHMDRLCATPYEEGMDNIYKIREYRDIESLTMVNRVEGPEGDTVEITDPSFLTYDWMNNIGAWGYGVTGLAKLPNMWILNFFFEVRGDGNCQVFAASEWDDEYVTNIRITPNNAGVMVKVGTTYYMVMGKDIVSR